VFEPDFHSSVCRWDDDVLVTRAPGRLDVMGGIADYSGSLVLQMPIAEACHVALQKHPLDKQKVWKHVQVRGHDRDSRLKNHMCWQVRGQHTASLHRTGGFLKMLWRHMQVKECSG
jgi:galactokinase